MNIALAQLNFHIGNFEYNFSKISEHIIKAELEGADLIVFPELSVCGYPPRDFLEFEDFIDKCDEVLEKIKPLTQSIGVIVGCPTRNPVVEGKDLFNSAVLIHKGKIVFKANKALLPTYDIFDEYRYFEPETSFNTVNFKGKELALTICEDIWNVGNENPMYKSCPMDELIKQHPDYIINISASPFDYNQIEKRLNVIRANNKRYSIPVIYTNHVGAQTDLIFDGGSIVTDAYGTIKAQLPYFEESMQIIDMDNLSKIHPQEIKDISKIRLIHDALVCGVRDYFAKLGFTKAILGLSGGIDSAVTAGIAALALGPKNVKCLLMPSRYSSSHSVTDSEDLCKRYGIPYDVINIDPMYRVFTEELQPYFSGKSFDVTEENIQSRARGVTLMAMCNKLGYILLNTTNKSEAAVGYGTLYGDLCGGLSVIADLYKTEVYELARYMNRNGEMIPTNIIDKEPSAELRPDQKDSDSLPPYQILDSLLYQYIECRKSPDDLIDMGFDALLVQRVLKMVNRNEWKRFQMAPVLRVSSKSFGMGRRMPIEGEYLS
jgi:NAD+ synthase (glutamine-hydrolysing)